MSRTAATGLPSAYGAEKLPTMRARWAGAAGAAVRAMGDDAGWSGTPAAALLGVTANSEGASDDTTATGVFHEIGLYQLPAGPVAAPANAAPAARWNVYASLACDPAVRALLGGRCAATDAGAWQADVAGQVATGLVSLAEDRDALSTALASRRAGTRDAGSQWSLALGVLAYVVGPAAARAALGDAPAFVASVPEPRRFGALVRRLVATRPGERAWGYPVVRTWQRLATGKALATALGQDVAWFDLGLGADDAALQAAVARAAYGGGGGGASVAGAVVGLGVLGAGAAVAARVATGRWPWELP
jgi:hypothetical protein